MLSVLLCICATMAAAQARPLSNAVDKASFYKHRISASKRLATLSYHVDTLKVDSLAVLIYRADAEMLSKMGGAGGKTGIIANALLLLQEYLDDDLKNFLMKRRLIHEEDIANKLNDIRFFDPDFDFSIYRSEIRLYTKHTLP